MLYDIFKGIVVVGILLFGAYKVGITFGSLINVK